MPDAPNMSMDDWIGFEPKISGAARKAFISTTMALEQSYAKSGSEHIARELESSFSSNFRGNTEMMAKAKAATSLAADLLCQGWAFKRHGDGFMCKRSECGSLEDQRVQRRGQLAIRRDEQLLETSIRKFVRGMEKPVLTTAGRFSIFDLMCDGNDLADRLQASIESNDEPPVMPYLQLANSDEVCSRTGLQLKDIWRYFRHTWANSHESIPGRLMQILVRDAASQNHPIIGILALGSSPSRVGCRDKYIGWTDENIVNEICSAPTARWTKWIQGQLDEIYSETYRDDLVIDGLIPAHGLVDCTSEVSVALRKESELCRERHQQHPPSERVAGSRVLQMDDENWKVEAETDLFRSKRCLRLADIVDCACELNTKDGAKGIRKTLVTNGDNKAVRRALGLIVKYARSVRVGTEIAELLVCGAIPPYNEILVGKLVSMLAASNGIVKMYRERYREQASVIASSNAGRAITRQANLAFLSTTSLYGVRPSQYDRAGYPCEIVGGKQGDRVSYRFLDRTRGFGSSQISNGTHELLIESYKKKSDPDAKLRANKIFGEGANPKMRNLNQAIEALGLKSEEFLMHGQTKCVYCVDLISNTRDYLLGLDNKPRYLFKNMPQKKSSEAIVRYWHERWVKRKLTSSDVIENIRLQTTSLPVRHAARVELPPDDLNEVPLFADILDVF